MSAPQDFQDDRDELAVSMCWAPCPPRSAATCKPV